MGEDLGEVIKHFGDQNKIFYVHLRKVKGAAPKFHEVFVDQGNYNEFQVMKQLKQVGFDGVIIPDHVPHIEGDTKWGHRARAYAIGYLKSTLKRLKESSY